MVRTLPSARSDVFTQTLDLSTVIRNVATTIGAIVGASKKGPLGPYLVTNIDDFRVLYGLSDTSIGFMHLCAADFFDTASALYVNRAVSAGYAYPGVLIQNFGIFGGRVPRLVAHAVADFEDPGDGIDWDSAGGATDQNENLAYVHAIGPGAAYNTLKVELVSTNLRAPANPQLTQSTSGGTLVTGTYQYQVTALGPNGETLGGTVATTTFAGGVSAGRVIVSWDPVPGASGYKIYGRTSGLMGYIGSVPSSQVTFTDTGTVAPTGAVPLVAPADTDVFALRIYDTTVSANSPVETYSVTLAPTTDGFGSQSEIEEVVNNTSRYVRVVSNYANITQGVPKFTTLPVTSMAGGAGGTVVSDSDIVAAWDDFKDKDTIRVNVLINAGRTTTTVHNKMISLCESRRDSVFLLDVDPNLQQVQNVLNYRQITLNANSSRGMMVVPDYQRVDTDTNRLVFVPPSGAVASMIALTDFTRTPGTSPAGPNRGILRNAQKLRYNYDTGMRDAMALAQVSYCRSKLGVGTYLVEQLTLQTNFSALSFLSVRRMFDVMESAIETALQYSLQENNTEFTVSQIVSMLELYLQDRKRNGDIGDYAVRIDRTPSARGQGILGIDVAVEPTMPINQIALRAIITRQGEVSFTETV